MNRNQHNVGTQPKTERQRFQIAQEIIRRVDTVTLMTCEEVTDIHERAQSGEFDDIFDDERTDGGGGAAKPA